MCYKSRAPLYSDALSPLAKSLAKSQTHSATLAACLVQLREKMTKREPLQNKRGKNTSRSPTRNRSTQPTMQYLLHGGVCAAQQYNKFIESPKEQAQSGL